MTTEQKLEALKAINSEITQVERIIDKLSSGPGNFEISITPGLIPGIVSVCVARKSALMQDAQTLMK